MYTSDHRLNEKLEAVKGVAKYVDGLSSLYYGLGDDENNDICIEFLAEVAEEIQRNLEERCQFAFVEAATATALIELKLDGPKMYPEDMPWYNKLTYFIQRSFPSSLAKVLPKTTRDLRADPVIRPDDRFYYDDFAVPSRRGFLKELLERLDGLWWLCGPYFEQQLGEPGCFADILMNAGLSQVRLREGTRYRLTAEDASRYFTAVQWLKFATKEEAEARCARYVHSLQPSSDRLEVHRVASGRFFQRRGAVSTADAEGNKENCVCGKGVSPGM